MSILEHRRRRNKIEFLVKRGSESVWQEKKEIPNKIALQYLNSLERPTTRSRKRGDHQPNKIALRYLNKLEGPATRTCRGGVSPAVTPITDKLSLQNYLDDLENTVTHSRFPEMTAIATGLNFRGLALAIFLIWASLLFLGVGGI